MKKIDQKIAYCLVLIRDAEETAYLKENKFDKFPENFKPFKSAQEKIDSCIKIRNLKYMNKEQRDREINLLSMRFTAIIDDIK